MPSTIARVAPSESATLSPRTPASATSGEPGEQLGEAIAELAARLHAATYELLVLLHRFDATGVWSNGFRSCAHWLSWRTGIDLGAARQKVRVARALAALPQIGAAMACGELSYAKVRALTRVATPQNETQLLDIGRAGTAAHVEKLVRAWRRVDRNAAAELTAQRHLQRELTTWVDDDGMLIVRGRLTPEIGAVVQRALEAAADRLRDESHDAPDGGRVVDEVTPAQRRADALGRLAEAGLAADLDRGTAGDRYQVVLHLEAATLQADAAGPAADDGQAALEVGTTAIGVSADTSQRIACDAALVVMRHGPDGSVLDVGRRTRTIPPALRRALAARDGGCRFPCCTARRCDAHHVRYWAHGGTTSLTNTLLLCRSHHRLVHEGGFRISRDPAGAVTFVRPDGRPVDPAPAAPRWSQGDTGPLGPTAARLADAGLTPGPCTTLPHWDGHPFDVAWAIDVLRGDESVKGCRR